MCYSILTEVANFALIGYTDTEFITKATTVSAAFSYKYSNIKASEACCESARVYTVGL